MPIRHSIVALILTSIPLSTTSAGDLQLATPFEFPPLSGGLDADFDDDLFRQIDPVDFSTDGRFAVFASQSPLTADDRDSLTDIFLFDRDSGITTLVTRSAAESNQSANGRCLNPRISADGSAVVFDSEATDLVAGITDTNDARDVFLWDRSTGQTFLVSRADGGGATGNGTSRWPRISADGTKVVFDSTSSDLTTESDGNGADDVFLWQRSGDLTTLISESAVVPGNAANSKSIGQGFSDDGEAILIKSYASDLIPGFVDQNGFQADLYHWRAGSFRLASRATSGTTTGSGGALREGVLSPDGQTATFSHSGNDLVTGFVDGGGLFDLFQWREGSGQTLLISHSTENLLQGGDGNTEEISVSADGEHVAFETSSRLVETDATPGSRDIYRWSRTAGSNELVSRDFMLPFPGNGESRRPRISRDGASVVFDSRAHNLVNGFVPFGPFGGLESQIFVWQEASPIVLASPSTTGSTHASNAIVSRPWIAPDGFTAYFFTDEATDLVDGVVGGLFRFEISSSSVELIDSVFKPESLRVAFDGRTDSVAISDDGRFVALDTTALGMVDGFVKNPGALEDVFLWDRLTGEVTLVSRSIHDANRGGNETSQSVVISGDGSLVLFESRATDLIPGYALPSGASSNPSQIYAWKRETGEMTLLSRTAATPTTGANDNHFVLPVVSTDGSFVVFQSEAPDIVAAGNDTNGLSDLFGWDATTDTVSLITVGSGGPSSSNGACNSAVLSDDGEFLAFRSGATDLIPGLNDTNGRRDVFLWQRATGTFTLVNHVAGDPNTTSTRGGEDVEISGDGSTVAFYSSAADLISGVDGNGWWNIYVWDRQSGNKRWVTQSLTTPGVSGDGDSEAPKLSFDGQAVIFISDRTDLSTDVTHGAQDQLFYWDATTGEVTTISRSVQNPGNSAGRVNDNYISNDGSKVCFDSDDSELLASGSGTSQAFFWDRSVVDLVLVSRSLGDPQVPGNAPVDKIACGRDGSSVAFTSRADDLVSGVVPRNLQTYLWRPDTAANLKASWASPTLPVPTSEPVSYTLSVENVSANLSTAAKAVITLPSGSTFLQATGTGWDCKPVGRLLSCRRIGPLDAGETTELILDIAAPDVAGNDCIHASVIWPGIDTDLSDNTVEVCTDFAPDDWGDAPDPGYPTLARSGGASHGFSDLFLGASVAVDVNGQPSPTADGDDTDGSSDEDGIVFSAPLVVGQSGDLQITASGAGLLDAYFDWNADGDWDDPGEKALDGQSVTAGSNAISLATPMAALTGPTFARFRFSSTGTAGPGGRAADGEVEDYAVTVDSIGLTATLTVDPVMVPEIGGPATFTLRLDNPGTQDAVITSLVDDLAGALNGLGTCAIPQIIASGASYQCDYTLSLSGPVDATETHTVSANGASLGFALTAQDGATVTFFDSIAPGLLGHASAPEGPFVDCDTLQATPTSLWVTFSEQLEIGPSGADDPTSYSLMAAGPDLDFSTVGCGPAIGDDQSIPLGVTYVPGADRFDPSTTQLTPADRLADGLYRLFTCDGLQDLGANSVTGGDLAIQFRVDDGNLFDNGHFDCDLRDWQPDPSGAGHDLADVDGSPQSGSLRVSGSGGLSLAFDQCVPVPGGQSLTFDVSIRFDDDGDSVVGLARSCAFFADGVCTGLAAEAFELDLLEDTSGFVGRSFELQIPVGASSAACGFAVDSLTDGAWDLYLDAASLRQGADLFIDDFESGDTSAWSATEP